MPAPSSHLAPTRVAAVTGAGSGIGEAVATRLAQSFHVAVIDIHQSHADEVAHRLCEQGGSAIALAADVRSQDAVNAVFDKISAWRKPVDALVNSAGILNVAALAACTPEEFRTVLDVNVTGSFLCAQRAGRDMVAQGYGRIVNLASISGVRAGIGRVAYGTSKAAVAGLTRQFAMELGSHGVTTNAVAPGPIVTALTAAAYTPQTRQAYEAMIPARRLGTTADVAAAIAFLVSEEAAYINGVVLPIDGGYLAAGVAITGSVTSS